MFLFVIHITLCLPEVFKKYILYYSVYFAEDKQNDFNFNLQQL